MLVKIKTDAPIDFNLEESIWGDCNKDEAIKILEGFEFYSLVKKFLLLNKTSSSEVNSINTALQNKLF